MFVCLRLTWPQNAEGEARGGEAGQGLTAAALKEDGVFSGVPDFPGHTATSPPSSRETNPPHSSLPAGHVAPPHPYGPFGSHEGFLPLPGVPVPVARQATRTALSQRPPALGTPDYR